MKFFDMPLDELQAYRPQRSEPADFDTFWDKTLAEARLSPLNATFTPVDFGLATIESFDVTFNGYGGQPIKGWLQLPKHRTGRLPCVVEFIGYGGGRGFPIDWLLWASAGYAHLIMDTRGQGSSWLNGDTPDAAPTAVEPQYPGFMTRGILSPNTYYYRRVFTDAVRCVEAAQTHPAIDPQRIAVTGRSQGGGISIAVGGLCADVKFVMPDVPFLCHYRRAFEMTDDNPYQEIVRYCLAQRDKIDQVYATLAYHDGVNFAARAKAEALFSVGLMDTTCPPSTVFAAYNHYQGPKAIRVWQFNDHEGGGNFQVREQIKFLSERWSMI